MLRKNFSCPRSLWGSAPPAARGPPRTLTVSYTDLQPKGVQDLGLDQLRGAVADAKPNSSQDSGDIKVNRGERCRAGSGNLFGKVLVDTTRARVQVRYGSSATRWGRGLGTAGGRAMGGDPLIPAGGVLVSGRRGPSWRFRPRFHFTAISGGGSPVGQKRCC